MSEKSKNSLNREFNIARYLKKEISEITGINKELIEKNKEALKNYISNKISPQKILSVEDIDLDLDSTFAVTFHILLMYDVYAASWIKVNVLETTVKLEIQMNMYSFTEEFVDKQIEELIDFILIVKPVLDELKEKINYNFLKDFLDSEIFLQLISNEKLLNSFKEKLKSQEEKN